MLVADALTRQVNSKYETIKWTSFSKIDFSTQITPPAACTLMQ